MTPTDALKIMIDITAQVSMKRHDHQVASQALSILSGLVEKAEGAKAEAKEEAKPYLGVLNMPVKS